MSGAGKNDLLRLIRNGEPMSMRQRLELTVRLSIPAIMAQLSSILMQFIDASMVGSLGAEASASIGLVSTTTWLFMGLCSAAATGFSVQAAHLLGAKDPENARSVLRQGLWLGGGESILSDASGYFRIFILFLPAFQLNVFAGGMLRSSGNMKIPSMLNIFMCILDVIFNFFFIFPTRDIDILGLSVRMPGAGLGVEGAALGTAAAMLVTAVLMLYYLCFKSNELDIAHHKGAFMPTSRCLRNAAGIGIPMGLERMIMCGAQIMSTVIVAPLGTIAIAANSFAITAESLCYMPGYGIADAATTLVGQSIGARRKELTWSFAKITVFMGMTVMAVMGVIMYLAAPAIIGVMTPVQEVTELGASVLRIEAFAEPMYAASIVAYGIFVGAGSTLVPCIMNLASMWAVRLSIAAILAPSFGLKGVWIAMCIELCFRGVIFLIRLFRKKWLSKI